MFGKSPWLGAGITLAVAMSAAIPSEARAAVTLSEGIDGAEIVPDEELDRNRGGFEWSGVEISLGAEMRTYLNGSLVLQSNVSWTPSGASTTQFVSGALTAVDASKLAAGILAGSGITMHVGDQSVFLANGGQTVIMQGGQGGLQNVLINRASNVQISQQLDATIGLQNYGQLQQSILTNRLGNALGDAIAQSTLGSGR